MQALARIIGTDTMHNVDTQLLLFLNQLACARFPSFPIKLKMARLSCGATPVKSLRKYPSTERC